MTALETLIANSIELSTIGSELYCTTTSLDSVDDSDLKNTLICSTTTTVLSNIEVSPNLMAVRDAQSYVQSMSVEQLEDFDKMLAEKQLEFEIPEATTEAPKTYKKI